MYLNISVLQRARLVLAAKGIEYERVNINLKDKPEWFLKLNPHGTVPVIEHPDGRVIHESAICCGGYYNIMMWKLMYRKIPIISPGFIFLQKAFLLGLFWGELIFGGAYYWKEFCISKWVWLVNKNSLKR